MNKHSVSTWNPIGWRLVRSPKSDLLECSWSHSVDCLLLIGARWSIYCWLLICWSNLSYITCLWCALCIYSSGIQRAAADCSLVIPRPWVIQKVTLSLFRASAAVQPPCCCLWYSQALSDNVIKYATTPLTGCWPMHPPVVKQACFVWLWLLLDSKLRPRFHLVQEWTTQE